MKNIVQLADTYDVERLRADLKTAEEMCKAITHFGPYHDGGWAAIPLYSPGGKTDAESLKFSRERYEKTPILNACRYFEEIVDSFNCPKKRIRIMRLEPGANIFTHRDLGDAWALGEVRLHIPIITSDQVYFYVDEERVMMKPGELWFCDFSRPHRVANKGSEARLHLVLDLSVNDWLREKFPPETLTEKINNWLYVVNYHTREQSYAIAKALGLGRLKRIFQ